MKTRFIPARRSMTVALCVGLSLIMGVAFALWTQTGGGSGSATAVNAQASVVTVGTATADLYPGFTQGDVFFKVTNPNPYPVQFTGMTPGTVTSSDPTNCPASNVTVVTKTGLTIAVPANTTVAVDKKIDDVVTMVSAAPDGCQSKTFTIPVTLTGGTSQ